MKNKNKVEKKEILKTIYKNLTLLLKNLNQIGDVKLKKIITETIKNKLAIIGIEFKNSSSFLYEVPFKKLYNRCLVKLLEKKYKKFSRKELMNLIYQGKANVKNFSLFEPFCLVSLKNEPLLNLR